MFQSTAAPIRRLTPQPTDRGRADCPSLPRFGGVTMFAGRAGQTRRLRYQLAPPPVKGGRGY